MSWGRSRHHYALTSASGTRYGRFLCEREAAFKDGHDRGLPDKCDLAGVLLTVQQLQLWFIMTHRNEQCNCVIRCGWREVFPRPNKKRKTAKKQTTISAWQTFEIWPQNTVSFIHRKSRGYLWRGVWRHLEVILNNIQKHLGISQKLSRNV